MRWYYWIKVYQYLTMKTLIKGGSIMPHIAITMYPGRSYEQKRNIAEKVQKLVGEELGIDKKAISVSVEDIPKEKWEDNMKQFSEDILYVKPGV